MFVTPQLKTQHIGDADLPYLEYEGRGPALIFLHATGFMPWLWHPIAREFAGKHRVIAPCFCNHRDTDPRNGGLKWNVLAKDLAELCAKLGVEKPALVGHSMGATIATLAIAIHGLAAEKLILIEPIFLPAQSYKIKTTVEQHPMAGRAIKRRGSWKNLDEAAKYFKSKPLYQNWDAEIFDLYLKHGLTENGDGLTLSCPPAREAALFMGGVQFDPWPHLSKVICPVLVLEGQTSENRNFIDYKKVSTIFPNGHYNRIEGAGHLIPMEKPAEIVRSIQEFLA